VPEGKKCFVDGLFIESVYIIDIIMRQLKGVC
jgi:hypothetical protein